MTYCFPRPIPSGWFRVALEDELAPGAAKRLRYFGQDLVLFVGESGVPQILDAYCPHLGAHLGEGGKVEGETLRCPFHGWRFDRDGTCVEVPYAKRIPARARVKSWPTRVRNGIVWAWHHPERAEPDWDVPEVAECEDAVWTPWVHHAWQIRTHPQEIAENTADPAHFKSVHGFPTIPSPEITFDGPSYRSYTRFAGRRSDGQQVESILDVTWHGMGIGITRSSGVLNLIFIGTHTPIEVGLLDSRFSFTVSSADGLSPEGGAGRMFIDEAIRQMEQDIPIWENKQFHERPALCQEDGPIHEFRAWAGRFY